MLAFTAFIALETVPEVMWTRQECPWAPRTWTRHHLSSLRVCTDQFVAARIRHITDITFGYRINSSDKL